VSDDPACGSDRHIVPVKRPEIMGRTKRRRSCSSPKLASSCAAPAVSAAYEWNATFALEKTAVQALAITSGSCRPPSSASKVAAVNDASL
jgi:hypothetical protein